MKLSPPSSPLLLLASHPPLFCSLPHLLASSPLLLLTSPPLLVHCPPSFNIQPRRLWRRSGLRVAPSYRFWLSEHWPGASYADTPVNWGRWLPWKHWYAPQGGRSARVMPIEAAARFADQTGNFFFFPVALLCSWALSQRVLPWKQSWHCTFFRKLRWTFKTKDRQRSDSIRYFRITNIKTVRKVLNVSLLKNCWSF